jgi:hypothetical protein
MLVPLQAYCITPHGAGKGLHPFFEGQTHSWKGGNDHGRTAVQLICKPNAESQRMMLRLRLNLGVLPHIRKDPAIIIVISEK